MAVNPKPPGEIDPPNSPTPEAEGSVAVPNTPAAESEGSVAVPNTPAAEAAGGVAAPNSPTAESAGTIDVPNSPSAQAAGSVAIPNDPTAEAAGSLAAPNSPTAEAAGSVAAPNTPAAEAAGTIDPPNSPTAESAGSVAVPNSPAAESAGSVAIPNSPTAESAALIPRVVTPRISLNFGSGVFEFNSVAKALLDIVDYTRASSKRYFGRIINQWGQYEYPLLTDYVGTVTNLVAYSSQFNNVTWTKANTTVLTNRENNPINGARNAELLLDDATNGSHNIAQSVSATIGSVTQSWYVKSFSGNRDFRLRAGDSGGFIGSSYFDPDSGIVRNQSGVTSSITYEGDGWFRVSITFDTATGIGITVQLDMAEKGGATTTYIGDGSSGLYIYGAQLTESSEALPYVETFSTSASETFTESPCIEYDPVSGECLGYLSEPSITNLLVNSEDFTSPNWGVNGTVTLTENYTKAPDGSNTVTLLEKTGGIGIFKPISITTTIHTYSIYVKKPDGRFSLYIDGIASGGSVLALFDENADFVSITNTSAYSSVSGRSKELGGGFYRVELSFIPDASEPVNFHINLNVGSSASVIQIWGAQVEAYPHATSYIRTESSTVTRSSDYMIKYLSLNVNELTMQVEGSYNGSSNDLANSRVMFEINNGNSDNRLLIYNEGGKNSGALIRRNSVNEAFVSGVDQTDDQSFRDVNLTFDSSGYKLYIEGELADSDQYNNLPDNIVRVCIGNRYDNASQISGHIKTVSIYDYSKTAQEVAL